MGYRTSLMMEIGKRVQRMEAIAYGGRVVCSVALAAMLVLSMFAVPQYAVASDTNPLVPLTDDFGSYWTAPGRPYDGSGPSGKVLNAAILKHNDAVVVAINHAGAKGMKDGEPTNQQKRALSDRDADRNTAFELKDGFGPMLGQYFQDGYDGGKLDLVKTVMDANGWSGNPAKNVHQYPRPYVRRDTWLPDARHVADGHNDMGALSVTLDIFKVPDAEGADGKMHSADYPKNSLEGSFPSGHTNKAYSRGVVLAAIIPQLAPEILARVSEAGNNRLVLGVHYPLDVMAGRVGGMASVAMYWKEHPKEMRAAARQLRGYLTARCKENDHASLQSCISEVKADGTWGYSNDFTDGISKKPVTDRASALKAYRARMTYGFNRTKGRKGAVLKVPANAELLLTYAYPKLSNAQRRVVLAKTAIAAGYPYERSSKGWSRINLARALSSKVTLNTAGRVVAVSDARRPSVVRE